MRRSVILFACLSLVLVGISPALANHNNAGIRFSAAPTIAETAEGDTSDDLRLIYHAGGALPSPADSGTIPRVSPGDQTGQGLGDWIGFIDGIIEHPTPYGGFPACFTILVALQTLCSQDPDPLYRFNPEQGDEECDDLTERANTTRCTGEEHRLEIDFFPGPQVANHDMDVISNPDADGSGFSFPGHYSYYIYLFGDGTGPAAGSDHFSHLDPDLCEPVADGGFGHGTTDGDCNLIMPGDLNIEGRADLPGQHPAVCMYRPFFTTISGSSDSDACPNISEFNQFFEPSDSSLYLTNKPGWYLQTRSQNTGGSVSAMSDVVTLSGDRDDIATAGVYHYYVNPVRPGSSLWCMAPPISTAATDGIDTGLTKIENEDGSIEWSLDDSGKEFLLEAHDIDVYMAHETTAQAIDDANALIDQVEDTIPGLPPIVGEIIDDAQAIVNSVGSDVNNATGPTVDAINDATARADPDIAAQGGEPNRPGDNSWDLIVDTSEDAQCDPSLGLTDGSSPSSFANRIQTSLDSAYVDILLGDALHDYTYTDDSGLPHRSEDTAFNPWHPEEWTFSGSVLVVNDLDNDQVFDGCPPGDDPPDPGEDICAARMPFDVYNDDAIRQSGKTIGEVAFDDEGYRDPMGMYFVLKVTGPVLVEDDNVGDVEAGGTTIDVPEPTGEPLVAGMTLLANEGQNCIVGVSTGLTEAASLQDSRFRTIVGADAGEQPRIGEGPITEALCDGADGDHMFVDDAFDDAPTAGSFSSSITWIPLVPQPEALEAQDDGLEINYLVTAPPGGALRTNGNINLGALDHDLNTPTVVKVWDGDGSDDITYEWTEVELFDSEPGEPSD